MTFLAEIGKKSKICIETQKTIEICRKNTDAGAVNQSHLFFSSLQNIVYSHSNKASMVLTQGSLVEQNPKT